MQSRKCAARILTKGSSNLLHITNFSLVWVPPVMYTWQANSRKNESDMMNTSVSWDAMMMAVDSSSACFACRNMPVSASSCVLYKLSTQGVLCYPKAFSLIGDVHDFHDHPSFNSTWLCYESLSWLIASTSLGPRTWWHCFCFWVRTKDASTALLCGQQRCCWKEFPLFDPRLTLSSFLMDSSRYTSNTTSIRELSAPVHGADMKMASESSAKVLFLPWTLWTRLIPSMVQVDGCSIASVNDTFFPAARPVWTCLSFLACHHNYQATMAMVQVDGSALISCPTSCLLQWVPYGQTTCGLLVGTFSYS